MLKNGKYMAPGLCCGLLFPFSCLAAQINRPAERAEVVNNDIIATRPGSPSQLQFGANLINLGPKSQLRIDEVSPVTIRLHLISGAMIVVRPRSGGQRLSIAASEMQVTPEGPGSTKVSLLEGGTTLVTVRSGQANVRTAHGVQKLSEGQTLEARFNGQTMEFQTSNELARDDLDLWVESQSRTRDTEEARGWNDREWPAYGPSYPQYPPYGAAYSPQIQLGLSPYSAPYVGWYSMGPYGRRGGVGLFGLGGPGLALNFGNNPGSNYAGYNYPGYVSGWNYRQNSQGWQRFGRIAPPFRSFDEDGWHRSGSYFRPYPTTPYETPADRDGWRRSGQFRGSGLVNKPQRGFDRSGGRR